MGDCILRWSIVRKVILILKYRKRNLSFIGDLYKKITEAKIKNQVINEGLIINWVAQLSLAVNYMHENRILHRDIKPQNIFLTKEGIVN